MTRENPADLTPILFLGGLGALGYWLYTQGYFASWFTATPAASTGTPASSTGTPASSTGTPANTGTPAGASSYTGPTLDHMFQNLLAAEQAAISASVPDPALTCPGASTGTTGAAMIPNPQSTGIATNPNAARTPAGQTLTTPTYTQSALSGLGAVACAMPYATYDVHNWYLVNRANSGIPIAPDPPDHTTVLSLSDYWTWVAPLLKQQIPGLSGGFGRGLGAYAELGRLMRIERGY